MVTDLKYWWQIFKSVINTFDRPPTSENYERDIRLQHLSPTLTKLDVWSYQKRVFRYHKNGYYRFRYIKTGIIGFPVFHRIWFYHQYIQHIELTFHVGFSGDLISKSMKTDFSRFSGYLPVFILSPLKSAYSIYFPCRFLSSFDYERYKKTIFLGLPVFCRFWFYHHWNQRSFLPLLKGFHVIPIILSINYRYFISRKPESPKTGQDDRNRKK